MHLYWNAKCFLWHFVFLCWYQLFLLHSLAAKRIFNMILALIHWQRSDRHLGKITESCSYYQLFLGHAIKMIDDKAQPYLSKSFWCILQEVCGVFNTHAPQLPSKGPCGLNMALLLHKDFPSSTVCSGIYSQHRAACWDFLSSPLLQKYGGGTGKKIEGTEHEEIPEVWFRGR